MKPSVSLLLLSLLTPLFVVAMEKQDIAPTTSPKSYFVQGYITNGPREALRQLELLDTAIITFVTSPNQSADGISYDLSKIDIGYAVTLKVENLNLAVRTVLSQERLNGCDTGSLLSIKTPLIFYGAPTSQSEAASPAIQLPQGKYEVSEIWLGCK